MTQNNKELDEWCNKLYKEELKYYDKVKKIRKIAPQVKDYTKKKTKKIDNSLQELLVCHEEASEIVQNKIKIATRSLEITNQIIKKVVTQDLSRELPLLENKTNPPPLCGKVKSKKNYIVPSGVLVAAYTQTEISTNNWILCHVKLYSQEKQEYTLVDFFVENNRGPTYYKVPKRDVVPLPNTLSANHIKSTEFSSGSKVLAIYPETTTFYPAKVLKSPKDRSTSTYQTHYYLLKFDGDTIPKHDIYARWIIPSNPNNH
ncbi:saga-associated factor 29 [Anaeramoeba flamelloides]|uniref:Saga-associated factor n=1 Tax=Anaeramoeba flamelloides TaxID=1746091 RepID=A0AAV7Y7D5_9EUKA|nr:saga-associated factor [Anaeramoeba flamelloides]KAJ6236624.1 saga-associated factor 29 [Anaeramoeba flamelloides]